jgi:hypothetical protein
VAIAGGRTHSRRRLLGPSHPSRKFFPQYYPSHRRCGSLPPAPTGRTMGRMTNRFLDSYGLLLNRKLRNEPNEQGAFACQPPRSQQKITKRTQEARSKCGGAGGFACQPPRSQQKITKRTQEARSKLGGAGGFACQPPRSQQKITKRTQGLQSCGLRNLRNCSSGIPALTGRGYNSWAIR